MAFNGFQDLITLHKVHVQATYRLQSHGTLWVILFLAQPIAELLSLQEDCIAFLMSD